jgi:hypothetical protein
MFPPRRCIDGYANADYRFHITSGGSVVKSLHIDEPPTKVLLPGASKEALKNLPEFKYHA